MKTKMFSVYDTKLETFGTPFFMPTVGGAIRAFNDLARDGQTTISRHPKDYMLYMLAEFDDVTGNCEAQKPSNLGCPVEDNLLDLSKLKTVNGKEPAEVVS